MLGQSMLAPEQFAALKEDTAKQRELGEKDADITPEARAGYKKGMGNEAFKQGDHRQAAVFYTEAIMVTLPSAALRA